MRWRSKTAGFLMVVSMGTSGCQGGHADSDDASSDDGAATSVDGGGGTTIPDATTAPIDGATSGVDAFSPPTDAATGTSDATVPRTDGGIATDAAAPEHDASVIHADASSPVDAGIKVDASHPSVVDAATMADASHTPVIDAGTPTSGEFIGTDGGTVSNLYFAVIGDTRPVVGDHNACQSPSNTTGYPCDIINGIYQGVAVLPNQPEFAIGTGDFVMATPSSNNGDEQYLEYLSARSAYRGPLFPVLGNHDCANTVSLNCVSTGPNAVGQTATYQAFVDRLLTPVGQSLPYYSFHVNAQNGSWTSKFVFVAANAWDSSQASWLEMVLSAEPTTYTFVVRHEAIEGPSTPSDDISPGGRASDAIIEKYPYTLHIDGHVHIHANPKATGAKEVIVGNGGAPLNDNGGYGFVLVRRCSNGSVAFQDMVQAASPDFTSFSPDPSFAFAVDADGNEATCPDPL